MKAFKLKEDIRLYTGEDMRTEVLTVKARSIIDFSAAYDVFDPVKNEKVGALKRKGLKSILKDEWIVMDSTDRELGTISEESTFLAVIRRFVPFVALLLPQQYHVQMGGGPVASFTRNFNPFVMKITLDFTSDINHLMDRRLGLAAGVLLIAIEGRQND